MIKGLIDGVKFSTMDWWVFQRAKFDSAENSQRSKSQIFSFHDMDNQLQNLNINEKKAYVPPHLRNRSNTVQQQKAPDMPSAFTQKKPQTKGGWNTVYDRPARDSRKKATKSPDDEFYSRDDVGARDPRLENELFGKQHNSGINFKNYDDIPVEVSGKDVPDNIETFEASDLDPLAISNVKLAGYTSPTPVQKYAISFVNAGRDLMACAQTGSGKVVKIELDRCIFAANFIPELQRWSG
jgi:ATP-dependent RNA helicase DDX3X